ncbi:MAG: hypothetical protein ACQESB_01570 [Elusimicrobiota bacterium]
MKGPAIILFFIFFTCLHGFAHVREKTIGLGIAAGNPSGLSIKSWRGSDRAIDAIISWSRRELKFTVGFLKHNFIHIDSISGSFPLYYGLGSGVNINAADSDESTAGLRFSAGISYILPEEPIDIFFEMAPLIELIPKMNTRMTAVGGARYYF